MAQDVVVYTIVHQPRRIKLPAQPIPKGALPEDVERCLFDERMNERYFRKVARWCYYPATRAFIDVADGGLKLSIGFSVSFLRQLEAWDQELLALFQRLVRHENVELVAVEPYHSFILLLNLQRFVERMHWASDYLERTFGKRPAVADTTEMCMSDSIYHAIERAGFKGAVMDGRDWVMGWRDPTHLYRHGDKGLKLFTRHFKLSDDVGYRFSNRTWPAYPLAADRYSHWLRDARGDFVFLAWDYETFGEHHSVDTGIFDFLRWFPIEVRHRGMEFLTPSQAIGKYGELTQDLPLPVFPTTWAGGGGMEFFLGNAAQQTIFQLMINCYNAALLTGDPKLVDLSLWLLQSDNLHLIQWFGQGGSEAEVSAYFTPDEWWDLGPGGIIWEQQQVYRNFLAAMDPFL